MARRRTNKAVFQNYVLFGFKKSDIDQTGYWSGPDKIVDELSAAKVFPDQNISCISGYGTPQQWKELINSDRDLNGGFKFHLLKVHQPS